MKKYIVTIGCMILVVFLGCKFDNTSEHSMLEVQENGLLITSTTFGALSAELQNAMRSGGVANAARYCNEHAIPITDSLSNLYDVEIKRASDKVRNPSNRATEEEMAIIKAYKEQLHAGTTLAPQVMDHGPEIRYFAPILTNGLCLKCHGTKSTIADYQVIHNLYPDDEAIGYTSGELRGIWSVTFRKDKL